MANPVPAGSDVSAGTYRCTNCGNEMDVGSTKHLPPCPKCGNGQWNTVTGGDAADDPSPHRCPPPQRSCPRPLTPPWRRAGKAARPHRRRTVAARLARPGGRRRERIRDGGRKATAYGLFPLIREPWEAVVLLALAGAGTAAFWPGQSTLVAR